MRDPPAGAETRHPAGMPRAGHMAALVRQVPHPQQQLAPADVQHIVIRITRGYVGIPGTFRGENGDCLHIGHPEP